MNNTQILKSTAEEQKNNSRILKYFVFAFTAYDMTALEENLHENGVFFGKYSQKKALGIFYKIFFGEKGIHELCSISINYGIAISGIPGAEVVEFRCSNADPFTSVPRRKFGEPAIENEKVLRFCFEFKDDKIFRVVIPRKYRANVESLRMEN